jgi:hypothetical protein
VSENALVAAVIGAAALLCAVGDDGGLYVVDVGGEVELFFAGGAVAEQVRAPACFGESEELFVEGAEGGDCSGEDCDC